MNIWIALLLAVTLAQAPPPAKLEKIKDDLYVLLGRRRQRHDTFDR